MKTTTNNSERFTASVCSPRRGDRGTFPWKGDASKSCECEVMSVGKPSAWNIYVITVRYRDPDNGKVGRGRISHGAFTATNVQDQATSEAQ